MEFKLPDTGEGVTEGTFLEWLVEEGEEVDEDQTVAEVETDKAVVDVPAPASGTIKELKAEPGDTVDVGEVIMILDAGDGAEAEEVEEPEEESEEETDTEDVETETVEEGTSETEPEEDEEPETEDAGGEDKVKKEDEEEEAESSTETSSSTGDVLALPKVRKLAEEKGVDLAKIDGSGPEGRVTENDVNTAAGDGTATKTEEAEETDAKETGQAGESEETEDSGSGSAPANVDVKATPAVRQLAREEGIDLANVEGSGKGGKITREDVLEGGTVEESGAGAQESDKESRGETVSTEQGEVEHVEMTSAKKAVADKMEKSRFTAPHVTHVEKADVTELVELREEKKDEVDTHLTYLPFIMKAVLVGLKKHPELNAELDEENNEILLKKYYDFNIAVDTDRGLMVPVIKNIDDRTIVELAEDIDRMVEKTRDGEISAGEMQGGTFSITNLGVIGGEEFTPIINYPQTAILGIGSIKETAEVVDGEVVPRHTVKLSLSYDHRVIDGATGARFMNTVVENLEDPGELLMEI